MNVAHVTQWLPEDHLPQCPAHSYNTLSSMCAQRVSLDRAMSMTAPDNLWHIKLFGDKTETSGRTQISLSRLSVSTRHCR